MKTNEPKAEWHKAVDFAEVAEALGVNTVDIFALMPESVVVFTPRPDDADPALYMAKVGRDADGILVASTPKYLCPSSELTKGLDEHMRKMFGEPDGKENA